MVSSCRRQAHTSLITQERSHTNTRSHQGKGEGGHTRTHRHARTSLGSVLKGSFWNLGLSSQEVSIVLLAKFVHHARLHHTQHHQTQARSSRRQQHTGGGKSRKAANKHTITQRSLRHGGRTPRSTPRTVGSVSVFDSKTYGFVIMRGCVGGGMPQWVGAHVRK